MMDLILAWLGLVLVSVFVFVGGVTVFDKWVSEHRVLVLVCASIRRWLSSHMR